MNFWNDQVMNAFVSAGQSLQASTVKSGAKTQDDSFQKLLDRQQSAETPAKPETKTDSKPEAAAESQEKPETQTVETEDPKELEKRMALAAAAAAQNPMIAQLIEETPQVMTDPSWTDGLVPVGYDDFDGYRIVHWARPLAEPQGLEEMNAQAGEWLEEQNVQAAEAQPAEAQAEVLPQEREVVDTVIDRTADGMEQERSSDETPKEAPAEAPVFENVRDIPIKVGEAPKAEETPEVPAENQISDGIAKALEAGESRVELQLEPENLGKVTVELTMRENGTLHVAIHAENRQTANLLERGLDNLHLMLARSVRQEDVQVEVQHSQEDQRQDLYDGHQGHPQQGRQQQERRQSKESAGADFLHQLRLGLVPEEG